MFVYLILYVNNIYPWGLLLVLYNLNLSFVYCYVYTDGNSVKYIWIYALNISFVYCLKLVSTLNVYILKRYLIN